MPLPHSKPSPSTSPLWQVRRTAADGTSQLVTMAGEPWQGDEQQARERARVLGEEDPSWSYTAEPVASVPSA